MAFTAYRHQLVCFGDTTAIVWQGCRYSFRDLDLHCALWERRFDELGISAGQVVGLKASFSYDAIGCLFALFTRRCVVALVPQDAEDGNSVLADAQVEWYITLAMDGTWNAKPLDRRATHPLLQSLRDAREPGFVIFSSGSSGRPKAILHSTHRFLAKFASSHRPLRTLAFLLFDHIAGIDTLFVTLSAGGTLVIPESLDVTHVCRMIDQWDVEVLPTSPTFLNLLCLSGEYETNDLSSLRIITYGSEPMSPLVLERINELFPDCRIIQKYGTSEFGAPRSRSRNDNDLWISIKQDECQLKVVDGILWIKTHSAMLGYLNSPNPFDEDAWFSTDDEVEVDGEWIRILGRRSETINVGGEKVHPAEVEAVIGEIPKVLDAVVAGQPFPLTGQIVRALVQVAELPANRELEKHIRKHCRGRLARHKIPVKIQFTTEVLSTPRQKKVRSPSGDMAE